jgi:hypothetical protein
MKIGLCTTCSYENSYVQTKKQSYGVSKYNDTIMKVRSEALTIVSNKSVNVPTWFTYHFEVMSSFRKDVYISEEHTL